MAGRTRSLAASMIGYLLVGLLILWLVSAVVGTIFWLIRLVLFALVVAGLLAAYVALKAPRDR
jgi:hypothetical protein